jgi:coenzyme F420-0:L-glutamate ligase/coenzyme F420-1:gamma-L-glutamate ligase
LTPKYITVIGLENFPLVKAGDNLAKIIVETAKKNRVEIQDQDIIVISQKIVSKAEGRLIKLSEVKATEKALEIAKITGKDQKLIELILRESNAILKVSPEALIVKDIRGLTCINAGIDRSNIEPKKGQEIYALLPLDPDNSAKKIRKEIFNLTKKHVGIIICDTYSRPFRRGQVEFAIGIAGLNPLFDYRGRKDLFGYTLKVKNIAIADELACTAELVMGQGSEGIPVAIIKGLERVVFQENASIQELKISSEEDLFKNIF